LFELRGITKAYGEQRALDELSLRIEPATTTALIGPSGCGKSTLLRVLIGLVQAEAGEVLLDGAPLTPARLPEARLRMGYVIQQGGLFPHLTARGNATLMAAHLGWPRERIAAQLDELATLTHLPPDVLDRYPGELSGGQNQRVALMRALMLNPEILLLDEPLGALDPMVRSELQDELKQIFATLKRTVVLVTHDLPEAAFLADRIVLMRAGRVVQTGLLADMVQRPAEPFVERFVQAQRSPLEHMAGASHAADADGADSDEPRHEQGTQAPGRRAHSGAAGGGEP
jgi:osmoprotectant transport system ATP-binding protein